MADEEGGQIFKKLELKKFGESIKPVEEERFRLSDLPNNFLKQLKDLIPSKKVDEKQEFYNNMATTKALLLSAPKLKLGEITEMSKKTNEFTDLKAMGTFLADRRMSDIWANATKDAETLTAKLFSTPSTKAETAIAQETVQKVLQIQVQLNQVFDIIQNTTKEKQEEDEKLVRKKMDDLAKSVAALGEAKA